MAKFVDLSGRQFGRLTVLYRTGSDIHNNAKYKCKCSCGNEIVTTATALLKGHTQSCGCYKRDRSSEAHRKYSDPIIRYLAIRKMAGMIDRCYNEKCKCFDRYGGKGVTICPEWLNDRMKFVEWALENGYEPGLSIDRIDPSGPYCPENCRWIPMDQQSANRKICRYLEVDGECKTIADWADEMGVRREILYRKDDEEVKQAIQQFVDARQYAQLGLEP